MNPQNDLPNYDPNQSPVYGIHQIVELLPHRYPFLLVDKIIEEGEGYVVGIKNITINEPYFAETKPDALFMPSALLIEAMGQVGYFLVLKDIENTKSYISYFIKFGGIHFKNKVIPGDTVIFKVKQLFPIRRGIVQMSGIGYVGNKIVVEANLTAQIIPIALQNKISALHHMNFSK